MRRRLDIAASLVPKPPVLFLDEPTTGLDLTSRNELWEMIRELVDDGTTVLLTTQYLEEADQLAERIAVIDGGHVIANDTPAATQGAARRHRGRDGLRRRADRRASDRPCSAAAGSARSSASTARCACRRTRAPHVLVDVLRRFDADGVEPDTLSVREPSLDDVFLALTGHRGRGATEPTGDAA